MISQKLALAAVAVQLIAAVSAHAQTAGKPSAFVARRAQIPMAAADLQGQFHSA
jgi:hypothetical protein